MMCMLDSRVMTVVSLHSLHLSRRVADSERSGFLTFHMYNMSGKKILFKFQAIKIHPFASYIGNHK